MSRQALVELDIFELWDIAWAYKWVIGGITLAFAILSIIYALSLPNIYRAQAVLVAAGAESNRNTFSLLAGQLAGLGGLSLGGVTDVTEEALAVLRSRAFTERFIEEHDLMPQLFPDIWDAENGRWLVSAEETPTLWQGFRRLDQVRVSIYDRVTRLVTVSIDWPDPILAARWLNAMIDDLNHSMQQRAIAEVERNREFLEKQISETSVVQLQQALYRLLENEIQTLMLANGRREYAFKTVGPALVPERKAKPSRAVICMAITFGGGIIALLTSFVHYGARRRKLGLDST